MPAGKRLGDVLQNAESKGFIRTERRPSGSTGPPVVWALPAQVAGAVSIHRPREPGLPFANGDEVNINIKAVRKGLVFVAAVDASASMHGERCEAAVSGLEKIVDMMELTDR